MQDTRQQAFIGILDIYGFEVLDEGGRYEQFCINYANEVLQKEFDHHVFTHEKQLYMREGIDWSMLTFLVSTL
jgi:myosin-5